MRFSVSLILASISLASAAILNRDSDSAVYLAVSPNCVSVNGNAGNVNAGVPPLSTFTNFVSFGDQYSDNGMQNGSNAAPAVLSPPNPDAGGRPSNGPVWVEYLAQSVGASVKDYSAVGAVSDASQYPNLAESTSPNVDFISQGGVYTVSPLLNYFTEQGTRYDPDTTLYTVFFGINDFVDGGDLDLAAQNIAYEILVLSSSPTFARNFLIIDNYGRGTETAAGQAYKQEVFSSIPALLNLGLNVAFVDFYPLWNAVLSSDPGYEAFGYTNPGACLVSNTTTVGGCSSPETYFYWLPGYIFKLKQSYPY
ncbi:hypothetical protein H0H92_001715 [Tricholoma furcatifolium]|nr:hypothetical protein H0H92_001715 [Tricholoma furcatifolium]